MPMSLCIDKYMSKPFASPVRSSVSIGVWRGLESLTTSNVYLVRTQLSSVCVFLDDPKKMKRELLQCCIGCFFDTGGLA